MLNVRTVADLNLAVAKNLHRIDRSKFDVIVGIPRSGMLPASIIATALQMPLADVSGYACGLVHGRSGVAAPRGDRVLLVDDSCNKGAAMARAMKMLPKSAKATRLAVYGPYQAENVCDLWFEECCGPRVFAWNMWKHIRLARWALDFDGVLCRDPTRAENDDGPRYAQFLASAAPLYLPQREVGHIVTGRLEKYRGLTVDWLKRHRVTFGELHMMPYATKAERMAVGGRGQWKAEQMLKLGAEMFIESNPKQAAIIARHSGLPVWCTETQALA